MVDARPPESRKRNVGPVDASTSEAALQADLVHRFEEHRPRLQRFVMHRMDQRLLGRLDSDDVLQDAFVVAQRRYHEFADSGVPFYVWLRAQTAQVLIDLHRKHVKAQARATSREQSLNQQLPFQSSADALGDLLAASGTTPSAAAVRGEQTAALQQVLEELSELDREIIVLRHLEQLSNGEVASVLNIDKSTASKRYVRALVRLREKMGS